MVKHDDVMMKEKVAIGKLLIRKLSTMLVNQLVTSYFHLVQHAFHYVTLIQHKVVEVHLRVIICGEHVIVPMNFMSLVSSLINQKVTMVLPFTVNNIKMNH